MRNEKYPLFCQYANRLPDDAAEELFALYTEPHRFYHNIDHIERLLGLMEEQVPDWSANWIGALANSILFHDAVYYLDSKHNEELSAAYAVGKLWHVTGSHTLNRLERAILATKSHTSERWNSEHITIHALLDFDLWDIGSDWWTFYQNTVKIRAEAFHVPIETFAANRIKFFEMILASKRIFRIFTDREEQARANIIRECGHLTEADFLETLDDDAYTLRGKLTA